MTDRDALIAAFLDRAGWGDASVAPLAGDASNRRYLRLHLNGAPAVLMDAPPDKGEDVRPFITIDELLLSAGLSAPRILAADKDRGFLLLEDLGDAIYARQIERDPPCEEPLYEAAVDVLARLHRNPIPGGMAAYDAATMGPLAGLAVEWYLGGVTGRGVPELVSELADLVRSLCQTHTSECTAVLLRDYHAENLIWLADREGLARVGLLDFQDAMAGHPVYDLVSLLQDYRRDVSPAIVASMKSRFLSASGPDPEVFEAAYATLGAQRALRVLGVFARLCLRDGKAHYVDLIPRVWSALQTNLRHPSLASLAMFVNAHLPPPEPDLLERLKAQCRTHPTPP